MDTDMSAAKPPGRTAEGRKGSAGKGAAKKASAWKESTEPANEQAGSADDEAQLEDDALDGVEFAYASPQDLLAQW